MGSSRPVIHDLKRSGVDIALETLALIGVLSLAAFAAYYYPRLPQTIPTHFNFKGEPDGWGGKGVLIMLPAIGVILYTGLTVLAQFPHIFNYPWAITEANARRQYAISRQMMSVVKLDLVGKFFYITGAMIRTATGIGHGLSPWFTTLELHLLFGAVGFYLFKAKRAQ
jgi:uncharacterized membrane protein